MADAEWNLGSQARSSTEVGGQATRDTVLGSTVNWTCLTLLYSSPGAKEYIQVVILILLSNTVILAQAWLPPLHGRDLTCSSINLASEPVNIGCSIWLSQFLGLNIDQARHTN